MRCIKPQVVDAQTRWSITRNTCSLLIVYVHPMNPTALLPPDPRNFLPPFTGASATMNSYSLPMTIQAHCLISSFHPPVAPAGVPCLQVWPHVEIQWRHRCRVAVAVPSDRQPTRRALGAKQQVHKSLATLLHPAHAATEAATVGTCKPLIQLNRTGRCNNSLDAHLAADLAS